MYADPELRKNRDIVMAAVTQDGWALEYADPELTKDRVIDGPPSSRPGMRSSMPTRS